MSDKTFVASVRVRMIDLVGIRRFLIAQDTIIGSKAQVLSAGIRFLGDNIPDNFKCNSNREAFDELVRLELGGGTGTDNKLAKSFRSAIEQETDKDKDDIENQAIIANFSLDKIQKDHTNINTSELPEELIISDSAKTKSGLRINTNISEVPGNSIDIRAEMLRGGKDE